jgi:hypothetical protein
MSSKLHDFGNPAAVQIVMVNQIHVTAISFFSKGHPHKVTPVKPPEP